MLMKQKILIVDPVPIVRYGLTQLINTENDLVVCGEAVDAPQAVQLTEGLKPDLVITDITIECLNGIEIIRQLKAIQRDRPSWSIPCTTNTSTASAPSAPAPRGTSRRSIPPRWCATPSARCSTATST